jgi:HSP20 family protein
MTKLRKWEPFSDLLSMRRDFDRLMDDAVFRPMFKADDWAKPLMDVYQTDEEIVIEAALPGIAAEEVDIKITGDTISIKAEKEVEKEDESANYLLREQSYKAFERTLTLPVPVKADKADAKVIDGMLHLHLPKAEEAKDKIITVNAK